MRVMFLFSFSDFLSSLDVSDNVDFVCGITAFGLALVDCLYNGTSPTKSLMPIHSLDLRTDVIKIQHPLKQSSGNYRLFSCLYETEDVCGKWN